MTFLNTHNYIDKKCTFTFSHSYFPGLGLDNVVNNIGGLKVADRSLCHFYEKNKIFEVQKSLSVFICKHYFYYCA